MGEQIAAPCSRRDTVAREITPLRDLPGARRREPHATRAWRFAR
jgi:hypothetical protein